MDRIDGPKRKRAAFWIDQAVTADQYVDPSPTVRPVSVSHRNEALATADLFDLEEDPHPWKAFGNCLGVDPDLFFPERGDSTKEAKEVCRGCVVREECLEYALTTGEKFGIWGGRSERERRRLRRARALARAAR
jgi:WhiB family redox-sensing transcriptional regulator